VSALVATFEQVPRIVDLSVDVTEADPEGIR
jgi:hypothetical protein